MQHRYSFLHELYVIKVLPCELLMLLKKFSFPQKKKIQQNLLVLCQSSAVQHVFQYKSTVFHFCFRLCLAMKALSMEILQVFRLIVNPAQLHLYVLFYKLSWLKVTQVKL